MKCKNVQLMKHMVTAFAIFLTAGVSVPLASAADGARPVLSVDDCAKCHDAAPKAIESNGGKHKTSVTCVDCHQGHPPDKTDIIPQCGMCHSGEKHFQLEGCLNCHKNPHTPLAITFADNLTDPCLTCHTEQIEQLKQNPSKHTELFCTFCHTKHGEIPDCTGCHTPHAPNMVQSDCLTCHKVHMPRQVAYPDDISSKHCAACHDTAYNLLIASPAKHKELACAYCHKSQHKMVPKCQDCHGVPHPDGMMQKFAACGDCHGIAHNINK
ncbi:MAG: cytochrome C [Deltaproteobacteria bacterium]|nr:cytochrome C [Deltaproteobacteria bacterium]